MDVLDTGYCWASEHHVRAGAAKRRIQCHSLVALLKHPDRGWVLFDTGYAPRFLEATARFPQSIYRRVVPVEISSSLSVVNQLRTRGLDASDIRYVILSHFHADHVSGLLDFPDAAIVCTRTAYEHVRDRRGLRALSKAYLPELMPTDFADRAQFIDQFDSSPLNGLGATHDLFDDDTIRLVPLPGHARGQIGALIKLDGVSALLAADGCWQRQSYIQQQPPHWITHIFVDDVNAVSTTLAKLGQFHRAHPDVTIIPTHCPAAYAEQVVRNQAFINDQLTPRTLAQ